MDRIRFKLPSRNWTIFTSVVGTIFGSIIYDKIEVRRIQTDLKRRARLIGDEPAKWNAKSRSVMVYLDTTHWSNHWFKDFVKPIFDAGALDYVLVESEHNSNIIESVRNIVWDSKEINFADSVLPKVAGWFGSTKSPEELARDAIKEEQMAIKTHFPHLYKPKFDPEIGIIGIGTIAWRHILYGLKLGISNPPSTPRLFTKNNDTLDTCKDSSLIELPVLGYIAGKNLSGLAQFPSRFIGWFNKRAMAEEIGEDALAILENRFVCFTPEDCSLGAEDFRPSITRKEKEASETDIINEKWSFDAENVVLETTLIENLKIYKK